MLLTQNGKRRFRRSADVQNFVRLVRNGCRGSWVRSSMPTRPYASTILLAAAFSLGVAACGGSADNNAIAPTESPASSSTVAADDSPAASDAVSDGEPADSSTESAESAETAANFFPDIDVLDVSTGDSANLATELGGGDTPVLLWFWAPH
jgi:hypothetical protein